jgi:hypothetical protein
MLYRLKRELPIGPPEHTYMRRAVTNMIMRWHDIAVCADLGALTEYALSLDKELRPLRIEHAGEIVCEWDR